MNIRSFSCIILLLGSYFLAADEAQAQFRAGLPGRMPPGPARPMFFQPMNPLFMQPFNPFFAGFNAPPTFPGNFVRAAQGNYAVSSGLFNPSPGGPYTLISPRGLFVPQSASFIPAFGGPYVLTTRQAFDPATNSLVASANGPYLLRTHGMLFAPGTPIPPMPILPRNPLTIPTAPLPNTNMFVRATPGNYSPGSGIFDPSATGPYALYARRGVFTPNSGNFVPAPFGPFVLTTRQAFDPASNSLVPSTNGPFVFTTRGTFQPQSPGSYQPFPPIDPSVIFARRLYREMLARMNTPMVPPVANPYLVASIPASNPSYGGYPVPYAPPYGSYGGNYGRQQMGVGNEADIQAAPRVAQAQQAQPQNLLAVFGVPIEDGKVQWPLALRLLSPEQKEKLLDSLEAQLGILATQSATGQVDPLMVKAAKQSVVGLRHWLDARRLDFAEGTYREADDLLRKVDKLL